MKEPELKVKKVAVDDLIPYANNAKIHTAKQVDEIVASMQEFGDCDPIAAWHNNAGEPEIIEGHGRLLALKKLGIETAPVIFLDHLTDEQRRVYTHVHNQTNLSTGFDYDTLVADMDNLNADWSDFGFENYLIKTDYDPIEDLCENEFSENVMKSESDSFALTFTFAGEFKEQVLKYVQEYGRDGVAQKIVEEAQAWE